MENMLNKLKSTISSAASNAASNAVSIASQVSNYLPGNPVTREFEATAHIASAGSGLSWKVYSGYKKSSRQDVSLFVFEKRSLDRWDRQDRELMLENLRRGVAQLTRIRHPQILTVQHPLEESRDSIAFATEPVLASLANVLGNNTVNMPSPIPSALQDYSLHDIEIKYGLMQVCEGLHFLHNSVKIVHCSLSPENIVVNAQGAWKLFGFDFCLQNSAASDETPHWTFPEYRPSLPNSCLPPIDYLAPECILSPESVSPEADMFSMGALTTAVFNKGKPYTGHKGDVEGYKRAWKELSHLSSHQLIGVPDGLKEEVRKCLQLQKDYRPQAQQLSQIEYFNDIGVKTLSYLDQIFQWDNMQKSLFYKGLPQLIPQLPHRVALLRIVPAVVQESVNPSMVPFILPVVLQIADRATEKEFVVFILPHIKPIMKITEPIQVMVQLMQKMSLLLSKTPPSDVRSDVLPLLHRALETETPAIQEMCLTSMPSCAKHLDTQIMKTQLLPRIQKLCLATTTLSVRVSCLVCVGRLLPHLDKWLVLDHVVPFITQLPSKEAPVIMAAVGILKVSLQSKSLGLTKEVMANIILPFILPLTIENCLTPQQHKTLMSLVRDMVDKIEAEHKTKLEYLSSITEEQKNLHQIMPDANSLENISNKSNFTSSSEFDQMFAGLGLGQYVTPSTSPQSARNTNVNINNSKGTTPTISPLTPVATSQKNSNSNTKTVKSSVSSAPRDLTASLSASPLPPPPSAPSSYNSLQQQLPVSSIKSSQSNNVTSPTFPKNSSAFKADFSSMSSSPVPNNKVMSKSNINSTSSSPFDNLLQTAPKSQPINHMMNANNSTQAFSMNQQSMLMNNSMNMGMGVGPAMNMRLNNSINNVGMNKGSNIVMNNSMNNMGMNNSMNMRMNNATNMGMNNSINNMGMNNTSSMMNTTSNSIDINPMINNLMMPPTLSLNNNSTYSSFKPLSSSDLKDFLN